MHWQTLDQIESAPLELWANTLEYPFLSLAYLAALETTQAASTTTGWQACHQLATHADGNRELLPLYRKTHSRGEYVFDQNWAAAYQRYGLSYYPKLITAIPFTPVTGPRLLGGEGQLTSSHIQHIKALVSDQNTSSWHGLFVPDSWLPAAQEENLAIRSSCQFLWRDRNYQNFEGYLAALTAKRRKTIKRERSKVTEAHITCARIEGDLITQEHIAFFYQCYASTYHVRGQPPYLSPAFFLQLIKSMPHSLMLVVAHQHETPVASALFFKDSETLYGRYWGCTKDIDSLHFEVCYYQGIEYCLEKSIPNFDPGTQGEHKLVRGFEPIIRHSIHWLAEPAFMNAIHDYVKEEREAVINYRDDALQYLPFRKTTE